MMGVFGVASIGMNTATHRRVLVLHELGASMRQLAATASTTAPAYRRLRT